MSKEKQLYAIYVRLHDTSEYLRQIRTKFTDIQRRLKKIEKENTKGGD